MSGVCETHGPYNLKKCDGCKVDEAAARHFPERLLGPWREEVAAAGLDGWTARMWPLFGPDEEAVFVLRREWEAEDGGRRSIEFHGEDRADLIVRAKAART